MKVTEAYNGINTSFKKLSNNIVKGSNKELSPHTEALIDNIKETLENIAKNSTLHFIFLFHC